MKMKTSRLAGTGYNVKTAVYRIGSDEHIFHVLSDPESNICFTVKGILELKRQHSPPPRSSPRSND